MRTILRGAAALIMSCTLSAAGPLCQNTGKAMGRSGCCSHHGGVCGCSGFTGMQRCCDGSNSPSCRCGD